MRKLWLIFAFIVPAWVLAQSVDGATNLIRPRTYTATYDPASLAAGSQRCDAVTVTGVTTAGSAVIASPGANPAAGCVLSSARVSSANTVTVCWQNTIDTITACDTASSTWTFTQAQ